MKVLRLQADIDRIDEVYDFIDEELSRLADVDSMLSLKLHMVVDEIFNNIARYAYDDFAGPVEVAFDYDDKRGEVILCFSDEGRPYDPLKEEEPDTTLSSKERKIGGLGIFMVKKTMDEIDYEYSSGKNILTLKKKTGGEHV